MKCFPKGIQKKNYKPQNEREINEYFLQSWPDLWALVWCIDDLETSWVNSEEWQPWVWWGPIFLCVSLKSSCWTKIRSLWKEHQWPPWQTGTLLLSDAERLSVNHKAVSLGLILLSRDWIWCPAGWMQSQAFSFYSWCFSVLWLGLPFVHCDHRQLISWSQAFLIYCFSTESWDGYSSVSNKWNDLEMHSVVIKVFESWHHSLEESPLRRGQRDQFPCLQREAATPATCSRVGRKEGLMENNLFCCAGKAHNRTTNLQWWL